MATSEMLYAGTSVMTGTVINTLADGAFAEMESISNVAQKALVLYITVSVNVAGAGGDPTAGFCEVFLGESLDGTDWSGGLVGTDTVYAPGTTDKERALHSLGRIAVNGTNATTNFFKHFQVPMGSVPPFWSVVIENQAGTALGTAAQNYVEYIEGKVQSA